MGKNVAQKLIKNHLVSGDLEPGCEIALKIDQTLTQDATGTMVMLELEAMQIDRIQTELSAQYVDHNLVQADFKNGDDHLFLRSACSRFGLWYSRPGNGVSHPLHMERFGIPGKTLLGSDSHTPSAGSLGMLAIGAGGLEVALAMAGEPYTLKMPEIMGVKLTGKLPDWVSAKDVILEMLRRHGVAGGVGRIIEYHGPGLDGLSAMDRHVIANMGAELGATTTVFPSDGAVRQFLKNLGRESDWVEIEADTDAGYDFTDEIDLGSLEPLIALPGSPGNVVPVVDVTGREIHQAYIGSSANPGLRDFAVPAMILDEEEVHPRVSLDINPTSRQILETLIEQGYLKKLVHAGARVHQPGCNGCIGMGQAPPSGKISLRTVPRNFPGRSGTKGDQVYLCSPETAAVSAIRGVITDPRSIAKPYPVFKEEKPAAPNIQMFIPPAKEKQRIELEKGPNIKPLPLFEPLPEILSGPVLLKTGDDVSTDEIMPAGSSVLPYRSNIPEIAKFAFSRLEENFHDRALTYREKGFFVVAGENYGQGSSREHAALAPRYLGLRGVIAKSYARIHEQNLCNFGILPLLFVDIEDYGRIEVDDELMLEKIDRKTLESVEISIKNLTKGEAYQVRHRLNRSQIEMIVKGGLINVMREKQQGGLEQA